VLPRDIARRMRRFEVRTRKLMESGLGGEYRSVFRGRGVEFDEARPYVEGDDVRLIDWNVTARTGEPYVKKHVEEREQTVVFVVDLSASVAYGSGAQRKRDLAAEVCCVLGVAAASSGDRTGLLLFTDRVERYVPPRRGARHAFAIARLLLGHGPEGRGTDIGLALEFLNRVLRRRAVVFLVSDFLGQRYERPLAVAARRHDLIAVTVRDPRESDLPAVGLVQFEDSETGERATVDLSDEVVRGMIARRVAAARESRERAFERAGADHVALTAGEPYDAALHRLFASRGQGPGARGQGRSRN
jgi:uncharacterized protein (DUF58 family)